jgi:hypothetical protein
MGNRSLLEKYSAAAETATGSGAAVRGFFMTVLTSLKCYNPHDLLFAMLCAHVTFLLFSSLFELWFLQVQEIGGPYLVIEFAEIS